MKLELIATATFGLEAVVKREIESLGYQILKSEDAKNLLNYIDVLVDGKFELENKSLNIKFRGSTNQRIINVPKSLKDGKTREIKKYDIKKHKTGKTLFV